ncbi:hypothetical protein Taro_046143 [Colocasia esculenta]|uniref:Uncharacterized protein n=1 Tax=Colocasia esculenta TaxID=4460 RepID=A0A843WYA6_COLES|nr:hypothetical protein [Colocasia esculenta]
MEEEVKILCLPIWDHGKLVVGGWEAFQLFANRFAENPIWEQLAEMNKTVVVGWTGYGPQERLQGVSCLGTPLLLLLLLLAADQPRTLAAAAALRGVDKPLLLTKAPRLAVAGEGAAGFHQTGAANQPGSLDHVLLFAQALDFQEIFLGFGLDDVALEQKSQREHLAQKERRGQEAEYLQMRASGGSSPESRKARRTDENRGVEERFQTDSELKESELVQVHNQ